MWLGRKKDLANHDENAAAHVIEEVVQSVEG
jgi:hypothetical protein